MTLKLTEIDSQVLQGRSSQCLVTQLPTGPWLSGFCFVGDCSYNPSCTCQISSVSQYLDTKLSGWEGP